MTTTSPLHAVPDPVGVLGTPALSEVARSVTTAQNLAGATRLEVAHSLVEQLRQELRSRDADDRAAGHGERPSHARLDPTARARDHLAASMALTCWHAARLVTAGVQIHTRLPRLRDAVGRGLLPEQLAVDAACRLAEVSDAAVSRVESVVVARITADVTDGDRPSRTTLDALIDATHGRHDPDGADDAVADATESRRVRFRPGRNGTATLWARLPIADAEKLRRRLATDARAAREAGDPRPPEHLRADALTALASDTTVGQTVPAAEREPIHVTVITTAAAGMPNSVEFVHGAYSSFDWLCSELLEGPDAKVRFTTIDPTPGVLDSPEHVLCYLLTPAMVERIRLRDGTCRHPGCTTPARHCDIDHIIAFDRTRPELGGPTCEWNLICLCRTHHREKTFGHNAYRPGPLGELIIITDTGHEHRTRPRGPLAHARDQILEESWTRHIDRLIAQDGYLTNPPGTARHRGSA